MENSIKKKIQKKIQKIQEMSNGELRDGDTKNGNRGYKYEMPATSIFYKRLVSPGCDWVCRTMIPKYISPNSITYFGWFMAAVAWVCVERRQWLLTALFWVLYALCDNLDGKQARLTNQSSPAGEYLDHVLDSFVSSFLALIIVAICTPACHDDSAFCIESYFSTKPYHLNSKNVTPFLLYLGLSQIPFFIGCWAHHVHGRLILGRRENITVSRLPLITLSQLSATPTIYQPNLPIFTQFISNAIR